MIPTEVNVRTSLDRVSSPPVEIAARISAFVAEMNTRVPLEWEELRSRKMWAGTDEERTAIVRRNASRAARRVPDPRDGYGLTLSADTADAAAIPQAVGNVLDVQGVNLQKIANRLSAGAVGVGNAVIAYDRGQEDMIDNFQREIRPAAESGSMTYFEENGYQ